MAAVRAELQAGQGGDAADGSHPSFEKLASPDGEASEGDSSGDGSAKKVSFAEGGGSEDDSSAEEQDQAQDQDQDQAEH